MKSSILKITIALISLISYGFFSQQPNIDILTAFNAIDGNSPHSFLLTKQDTFLKLPSGHDKTFYHQQGIQKLTSGGFAVSGSAQNKGYIYLTDADLQVVSIITPEFRNEMNEKYNHLGGFQVCENILAIGLERLESRAKGTSLVLFYDVADIAHPVFLEQLSIVRNDVGTQTAGAVGLVKMSDHWIVVVANWDAARVDMYRSNHVDLQEKSTHFSRKPELSWKAERGLDEESIDEDWGNYQNLNLFNASGELWMIGMHTDRVKLQNQNWADLYQVKLLEDRMSICKKSKKQFLSTGPIFKDGAGFFYHSTRAAFEVYACGRNMEVGGESVCNSW